MKKNRSKNEDVDSIVVRFAEVGGDGIQLMGSRFGAATCLLNLGDVRVIATASA